MLRQYLQQSVQRTRAQRGAALAQRLQAFGPRMDYAFRPDVLDAQKPGKVALERFEECMKRLLARLYHEEGIIPSEDQHKLKNEMRNSMLVKFFGSLEAVQNNLNWLIAKGFVGNDKAVFDAVAVLYPRRHGKTLTQAIVSACVLLSQVGGNVLAYNYTAKHARMWMQLCRRFLDYMQKDDMFGWSVVEDRIGIKLTLQQSSTGGRQATLWVFGNASDGKKAQALRGSGEAAFLINLDEFAFFHDEAFKVIFPAAANGAAVVLTSSRPPEKTTALELLEQHTKTGRSVVKRLDWRRLCDICVKEEQTSGKGIAACRHMARAPAEFRSYLANLRVMAFLEPFDNAGRTEMENETLGPQASSFFDQATVDGMLGPHAHRVPALPLTNHFFLGVDPGSTQDKSDTALVSACWSRRLGGTAGFRDYERDAPLPATHLVVRSSSSSSSSLRWGSG
jgi:hypothetical protein